jgi:hypothetical protein
MPGKIFALEPYQELLRTAELQPKNTKAEIDLS